MSAVSRPEQLIGAFRGPAGAADQPQITTGTGGMVWMPTVVTGPAYELAQARVADDTLGLTPAAVSPWRMQPSARLGLLYWVRRWDAGS